MIIIFMIFFMIGTSSDYPPIPPSPEDFLQKFLTLSEKYQDLSEKYQSCLEQRVPEIDAGATSITMQSLAEKVNVLQARLDVQQNSKIPVHFSATFIGELKGSLCRIINLIGRFSTV